jgi:hypothetical protein
MKILSLAIIGLVLVSCPYKSSIADDGQARRAREARERERERDAAREAAQKTRARSEAKKREGDNSYFSKGASMSAGELKRAAEAARAAENAGVKYSGSAPAGTSVAPTSTPKSGSNNDGAAARGKKPTP